MGHAFGPCLLSMCVCACMCVCCLWWEVGIDDVTLLKGMGIAFDKYTIPR